MPLPALYQGKEALIYTEPLTKPNTKRKSEQLGTCRATWPAFGHLPWDTSIEHPCSLRGGWTRWPLGVPSNPKLSMILWFPPKSLTKLKVAYLQQKTNSLQSPGSVRYHCIREKPPELHLLSYPTTTTRFIWTSKHACQYFLLHMPTTKGRVISE